MKTEAQLTQITELAKGMLLAGTLLKNVKRHFINLGMNEGLSDKICRIAELESQELQTYKSK